VRRAGGRAGTSPHPSMLAMALFATLATAPAPPASTPRVPGMRLRLGMTEAQVLAVGSFVAATASEAGSTLRKGPTRFFGVPGEATIVMRDGLLSEVRFEAGGVGAHSQDYVDDELRRLQLERKCQPDLPGDRSCDWTSPALRVHVEMKKDHLSARTIAWPPGHAPAVAAATAAGAPSGGAKAGAAAIGGAGAGAIAVNDSTPPAAAPVATLPETLTITVANRKSQAWPHIVSSPPLQYPDKAKQESLQGLVWVRALVDPAGRVLETSIERGIAELNDSALAWVRGSQFTACQKNGAPCRYVVRVAVLFTLY
jgi:TonB family protein